MDKINQYKEYRSTGIKLNEKILHTVDKNELMTAAKLLGMFEGNTIVFESNTEAEFLYDFVLNEVIDQNKSVVERYKERNNGASDIEKEILEALGSSYTSLYKVVSVSSETNTLEVKDLLNESDKLITITDLSFSQTAKPNLIIFTRLISLPQFTIASGANFLFSENHETYLLRQYKKQMKKAPGKNEAAKRFIVFFQLNRRDGLTARSQLEL